MTSRSAPEPSAALKGLSDRALVAAHTEFHARHKARGLEPVEVEAHHLLAEQLRDRGLDHPDADDGLHDAVITMSSVRVPIRSLSKMLGPTEVATLADMAARNGASFADVVELLTAHGWVLRAEPVDPETIDGDDADDPEDEPADAEVEDEYVTLTVRQRMIAEAFDEIVDELGAFDQSADANGAHYMAENPFAADGLRCSNCVAFRGGNRCEWVSGEVLPEAVCKLWVIDPARLTTEKAAGSWVPPAEVQAEARRALGWIADGRQGSGFTAVGMARARDLANGRAISESTLRRMVSYFARHDGDRKGRGWDAGSDGFPSPGRVAWAAWGGDAGRDWARRVLDDRKRATVTRDASIFAKAVEEQRFTLGPWYVPESLDAHDEWTDADELQRALWDYVKSGRREIRLQHVPNTRAGEWVEAMTWPFPVEVPMISPESGQVVRRSFPAGTVFLGVQWDDWAWDMVKRGQIRGFSIGGTAERTEEDPLVYANVTR